MVSESAQATLHPNSWLKEMAHLNPAKWNLSRSLRASVAIALPMLIGYFTNTLAITMWISMGAMFPSIGERDAPYAFTIKKILISAPIGASGFLMGYLVTWGLDWGSIVFLMSLIAFCTAIASSYSATLSIGCLQFMVMAAVSLGNPEIGEFWKSSLLLLCGTAFYLVLILIERFIKPHQIRKNAILDVLKTLDTICTSKIKKQNIEADRLNYNLKYEALYQMMLQNRYHALGHNSAIDQTADIVQNLDSIFAGLMACNDIEEIQKLQTNLQAISNTYAHDEIWDASSAQAQGLSSTISDLALALWGQKSVLPQSTKKSSSSMSLKVRLQKLTPGKATIRSALALTLCTAIGYSIRWVDHVSHWYWVPMTVAIVMKPELGSIFVRAVQRTVGTAAGVVLGGILLAFIPVGPLFILIIACITFVLPWLAQRNYALTAFAITPLVLVLIDFLSPARSGMEYASLRLVDTLIGCAIVLLFGYLLWPRRHSSELHQTMTSVRQTIAHYLELALANSTTPETSALSTARRDAYGKLVDMRAALQKSMAEPPPAGYEAAAWFPLIAAAARLCDAITVYSVSASTQPNAAEWTWLQQAPQGIAKMQSLPTLPQTDGQTLTAEGQLIAAIRKETHVRESLYDHSSTHKHPSSPPMQNA